MQNKFDDISLEEQALLAKIKEILGENSDDEVDEGRAKDFLNFVGAGYNKGKDAVKGAVDAFSRMRQGWNQTRSGASNVSGSTLPPLGRAGEVGQAAAHAATKAGQVGSAAAKGAAEVGKGAVNATKATARFAKDNPKLAATLGAGAIGAYGYNKAGGAEGIGKWVDDKKKDWFDFWDSNNPSGGDAPTTGGGDAPTTGGGDAPNAGGGGAASQQTGPTGGGDAPNAGGGGAGGGAGGGDAPSAGGAGGGGSGGGGGAGGAGDESSNFERQLHMIELDGLMKDISTYTDIPDAINLTKEYVEFRKKLRAGEATPGSAPNQPSSPSGQPAGQSTGNNPTSMAGQAGRVARRAGDAVAGGLRDFAGELLKEDVEFARILKNSGIK